MLAVYFHNPSGASVKDYARTADHQAFSTLTITDRDGAKVLLFLDYGRAQMVADAINAALPPAEQDAAR